MVVIFDENPHEKQGPLTTPFTELFGIKHPIALAGMNIVAGPRLAAAVGAAGAFPCLGGNGVSKSAEYNTMTYDQFFTEYMAHQTPEKVKAMIQELKSQVPDPDNFIYGIDILLPHIGGNARKTNYDYTGGTVDRIVDVVIEEKASMFVCALGAPPKHIVERLHDAGIIVATVVGHPKHVKRVLESGCDLVIAQGAEGGGHTGHVPTVVLVPMVVDMCKGKISPLTKKNVVVLAAGGIHDGRGLAASLMMGADGVWVGTRFVAATESGASDGHQKALIETSVSDTVKSTIFTGRPMRVQNNGYIESWEKYPTRITDLTTKGLLPVSHTLKELEVANEPVFAAMEKGIRPILLGQVSGAINEVKPAKAIIDEMVDGCVDQFKRGSRIMSKL